MVKEIATTPSTKDTFRRKLRLRSTKLPHLWIRSAYLTKICRKKPTYWDHRLQNTVILHRKISLRYWSVMTSEMNIKIEILVLLKLCNRIPLTGREGFLIITVFGQVPLKYPKTSASIKWSGCSEERSSEHSKKDPINSNLSTNLTQNGFLWRSLNELKICF